GDPSERPWDSGREMLDKRGPSAIGSRALRSTGSRIRIGRESAGRSRGTEMDIQKAGVIAAGQMGIGIAQLFVQARYDVLLSAIGPSLLEPARTTIAETLDHLGERERISASERDEALRHLHLEPDLTNLGTSELIVESAVEDEAVKVDIFKTLGP